MIFSRSGRFQTLGNPKIQGKPLFADLGFADPRGKNRKAIERALQETSTAVANYLAGVAQESVAGKPVPSLLGPIPNDPQPFSKILRETFEKIVPSSRHLSHPRYMAHMDSGVAFAGIVGDFIASALNQNMLAEELSPAATAVEQQVIRWFCDAAGLPPGSGGTFVGGGTIANLTALLAARDRILPNASREGLFGSKKIRLFTSTESHYSVRKSASILGIGSESVVTIQLDSAYRMKSEDLRRQIRKAKNAGCIPFAVVGTAGTTSLGSIDPLREIALIAKEENLWFHVDAAHGGALLFSDREKQKLAGIELADSISFDPHKWLWAPKSAGICVLRNFADFIPAQYRAPYLDRIHEARDLGRKTIEGSRHFDALKVWMIFRHLGKKRIGWVIERNIDLTQFLYHEILQSKKWTPLHVPEMNVFCFGSKQKPNTEYDSYRRLLASGQGWISMTSLQGRQALRTVLLNPSTTPEDVREILRIL